MMNPDGSQQVRLTKHRAADFKLRFARRQERRSSLSPIEVGSVISILCVSMDTASDPCFARHPHTEMIPPGLLMGKKLLIRNLTLRDSAFKHLYCQSADGTSVTRVVEMEKVRMLKNPSGPRMEQRSHLLCMDEMSLGEPPNPIYQPKNPRTENAPTG